MYWLCLLVYNNLLNIFNSFRTGNILRLTRQTVFCCLVLMTCAMKITLNSILFYSIKLNTLHSQKHKKLCFSENALMISAQWYVTVLWCIYCNGMQVIIHILSLNLRFYLIMFVSYYPFNYNKWENKCFH